MNNLKNNKIEKIYIGLVCIYSFISILNTTYIDDIIPYYNNIYKYMQLLFIFLFIFLIIINIKLTKNKLLFLFIFLSIVLLTLFNNNDKSLFLMILIILSFPKKMSTLSIGKWLFITNILAIVFTILLCKMNLITNYNFIQRNVSRYSYGFVSANAFSNIITATLLINIVYKNKNWKFYNTIFWIIILIIVNTQTNSRLALLLGLISLLLQFLVKKGYIEKCKRCIYIISKFIFPFLLLFSIIITIYLSKYSFNDFFYKMNNLFSGRIQQMVDFNKQYGIHFIGQNIFTLGIKSAQSQGLKWIGIDTSYLNFTLRYGLLFMTFVSFIYIKLGTYIKKNGMIYEAIYIILICLMCITENILFLPYYNFSLFFIAKIFNDERIRKHENINI